MFNIFLVNKGKVYVVKVRRETETKWVTQNGLYVNKKSKCYFTKLEDALDKILPLYKKKIDKLKASLAKLSVLHDAIVDRHFPTLKNTVIKKEP